MPTRKGTRPPEAKAKALAVLAVGGTVQEAADAAEVSRGTLWRWGKDDQEFATLRQRAIDAAVAFAADELRSLAPEVIEAFRRGLAANVRHQAIRVTDGVDVVALPDDSLAVRTADIVSRRIAELQPRSGLDVELSASQQLAELIRRLDADPDGPT